MTRIERTNEKYQRQLEKKKSRQDLYNPEFVAEINRVAALPPEAVFDNWEDAWKWLNK